MKQKAFVLQNRGMNRDLSVSKAGESSAYENHNIRILARDHDTLLSVTNERGNKEVELTDAIEGTLLGWNVLNNHVILFTHERTTDRIYRIDYYAGNDVEFISNLLYADNLGFDLDHPIESVVYFESEAVQKIYWVDGIHVLRFMNFMADTAEQLRWQGDTTCFDSNRPAQFDVKVNITKDNSGNNRANGVAQYLLTYFNKHGQETGYVWVSDLVYLSPYDHGGADDDTNVNSVFLKLENLDTSFTHFRIYSIFRSALNGTVTAYLVEEGETSSDTFTVIDDGAHLTAQDASRLLYLGSQPVHAGTLEHKDQTLFLGDLQSVGHDFTAIENAIKEYAYYKEGNIYGQPYGTSDCIGFDYSSDSLDDRKNIPYVANESTYPYENQLKYTSSQITTFKGGEKYRFALKFQLADGTESPAFWIGDKVNTLYPKLDATNKSVQRVIAYCLLPAEIVRAVKDSDLNIQTIQLCIAEATYADRAVKAQGILNPTMFNTWERYNGRTYSVASWISRPRGADYANRHFQPVNRSTSSTGEIECNWWEEGNIPTPYYRYQNYPANPSYMKEYGGMDDYSLLFSCYRLDQTNGLRFDFGARIAVFKVELHNASAEQAAKNHRFEASDYAKLIEGDWVVLYDNQDTYKLSGFLTPYLETHSGLRHWSEGPTTLYAKVASYLRDRVGLIEARDEVVSEETFFNWFGTGVNHDIGIGGDRTVWFSAYGGNTEYGNFVSCANANTSSGDAPSGRWLVGNMSTAGLTGSYIPAYATKHIMFVDENVVTLNSPEIEYEAVTIDESKLKLRIIGLAKITSGLSDYTVVADPGKKPGESLVDDKFSWIAPTGNKNGLLSWPLWEDRNLEVNEPEEGEEVPAPIDRTSQDYHWGATNVRYWLHMWNRSGSINGFVDEDYMNYGFLNRKVFANLKFSYETVYAPWGSRREYDCDVRQYNYLSSQYVFTKVGGENKYYNANVQMSLLPPWKLKYPVLYSVGDQDTNETLNSDNAYLYSQEPVQIEYRSNPHVVIALPTEKRGTGYSQTILPYVFDNDRVNAFFPSENGTDTGALVPWIDQTTAVSYHVNEGNFPSLGLSEDDMYLFVGELYQTYEDGDSRYGGTTDTAVANCRFIPAGPQFLVSDLAANGHDQIYANQGDTYFQRWDCLKTKPMSSGSVNNVIDITSVMLETHVNIDGRTDLQRGINELASIDTEKFGSLNPVYSQPNNYRIQRDMDEDYNTDAYHSSLTWTLEKHDLADVDEWTHVTLASTLNLDGDKGSCRAIRRFNNNLIAFQDRGISEILFNSRTQLSTQDGVPVEIANSGKVDGKRYITNHYGCTNKWSIAEGKAALYFVDNINKAFCSFGAQGITSLSNKLGFSVWFKDANNLKPWTPTKFDNIISFYDKVRNDVYLIKGSNDDMSCLVYNENLDAFTSFFDYGFVPMMVNVEDRFLSFKNRKLWKQNEGLYCNFFGNQYDYWTQYRVTPEPFSDKIWTNIDYRADFYEVLDENGESVVPEEYLANGDSYGELDDTYKEWETFTTYKVWNEYQTTGDVPFTHEQFDRDDVRKKFRIWRLAIPRALKEGTNHYGMDRIRNPWINLLFRKSMTDNRYLMQLHDIVVKYFE